jgi:hypothetical protein
MVIINFQPFKLAMTAPTIIPTPEPITMVICYFNFHFKATAIGSECYIAEPRRPQMHQAIEWAGLNTAILISPIREMKQLIQQYFFKKQPSSW